MKSTVDLRNNIVWWGIDQDEGRKPFKCTQEHSVL